MLYTYHITVKLNAMKLHRFNDLKTCHRPEIFALFKETQWNSMKLNETHAAHQAALQLWEPGWESAPSMLSVTTRFGKYQPG